MKSIQKIFPIIGIDKASKMAAPFGGFTICKELHQLLPIYTDVKKETIYCLLTVHFLCQLKINKNKTKELGYNILL